jgi:polyphenol oxidase
MVETDSFLAAEWPAPPGVHAYATTRRGGVSEPPLHTMNLGGHVDDSPERLAENRRRLRSQLRLPAEPQWLTQVHGAEVVRAPLAGPAEADGSWTDQPGVVCAVLTADCLPVLLCEDAGREVAALHAGWRGLAGGILEAGVARLQAAPERMMAWLGPAIGPAAFEVGAEVRAAFLAVDPGCGAAFQEAPSGRWLADLYALARLRLRRAGVERIYGGGLCTYRDAERFFSYRRDGRTGRMATLVWRE